MCTPIIKTFSFQRQFFTMEHYPPVLHNLRVKISETLHLHGVHFEEHLKTIWFPTLIPSLKIKVG